MRRLPLCRTLHHQGQREVPKGEVVHRRWSQLRSLRERCHACSTWCRNRKLWRSGAPPPSWRRPRHLSAGGHLPRCATRRKQQRPGTAKESKSTVKVLWIWLVNYLHLHSQYIQHKLKPRPPTTDSTHKTSTIRSPRPGCTPEENSQCWPVHETLPVQPHGHTPPTL